MAKLTAVANEDIPANRLCCLDVGDDPAKIYVRLATADEAPDFCSTSSIASGEEATVEITDSVFWNVEVGSSSVPAGSSVNVLEGGMVGHDGNLGTYVGYTLEQGNAGDVVKIRRNYKVKSNRLG